MVNETDALLNWVRFEEMVDWNIKQLFKRDSMGSPYEFQPLGKSLRRRKEKMIVQSNEQYSRITIKTNRGGVLVRDTVNGNTIKTKKQFYVHEGQLTVSKIDARNGAFGIVPKEAEHAIITENFWVYDVEKDSANIQFFILLFSSEKFMQVWQDCSNGSGNRLYLQEDKFLNYQIPFPTLAEQNALVAKYENTMAEADVCQRASVEREASIEQYLFTVLKIAAPVKGPAKDSLLSSIALRKLFKWGADFNLNAINPKDVFKSAQYQNAPLTSLCEINPSTAYPNDIELISFLPMECISAADGEILETRLGNTAQAKGYTRFQENDVLWAKITPCMQNGNCVVARNLKNGFGYGSTEFHVFRAFKGKALPEYLHCFLRTSLIRKVAQTYFTGSTGQQRVGADFLEALTLPLLPITSDNSNEITQTEIVTHIAKIKAEIKVLRQKSERLRVLAKKEFEEAILL